jgi:3-oxoacyl-[acyl-carrier-protein] synthase-3
MSGLTILGTGSYSPPFTLTNQMLESIVETNDEWITLRTGIKTRPIASGDETLLSMATAAAQKALATADKTKIGVIVSATLTPDYLTPSLSCLLQRDLELPEDIIAMDINCACSGFVTAIKTAYSLLEDRPDKIALVLGCEMLSRVTDYTDRTTCVLFGDGAGAAVIRRTDDAYGSIDGNSKSDSENEAGGSSQSGFAYNGGARGNSELLVCKAGYLCNSPFVSRPQDKIPSGISMNGQEVFRFAIETCTNSVSKALTSVSATVDEVDHFIFHQANLRIIDGIAKRMGIPIDKCVINIENHGNTSSATCAIALDDLFRSGKVKAGDRIVISAFGGGLTYATVYFVQNEEVCR